MSLDSSTQLAYQLLDIMLQNHEVDEAFNQQLMDERDQTVEKLIHTIQRSKRLDAK